MELTRFRRSLRRMSSKSSSCRDVQVLLDIADMILEESQFYEDNMKQHSDYGDVDDLTMGFFVDELISKVVVKLCNVEGLGETSA